MLVVLLLMLSAPALAREPIALTVSPKQWIVNCTNSLENSQAEAAANLLEMPYPNHTANLFYCRKSFFKYHPEYNADLTKRGKHR